MLTLIEMATNRNVKYCHISLFFTVAVKEYDYKKGREQHNSVSLACEYPTTVQTSMPSMLIQVQAPIDGVALFNVLPSSVV